MLHNLDDENLDDNNNIPDLGDGIDGLANIPVLTLDDSGFPDNANFKFGDDGPEDENDMKDSTQDGDGNNDDDIAVDPLKNKTGVDVEETDNPFLILGKYLQEEGALPAGEELPSDITDAKIAELYASTKADQLRREIETDIYNKMRVRGWDPALLETESSEVYNLKTDLNYYKQIAALEMDSVQNLEKTIEAMGKAYYIKREFSDEEATDLVTRDIEDFDQDDLFAKYQKYFKDSVPKFENKIQAVSAQFEQQKAAKSEDDRRAVVSILDSGVIDGVKYSKADLDKLKDGLFNKNQVYDNGKVRQKVSLYEKYLMEDNENPHKQLALAAYRILGLDAAKIAERSEKKAEKEVLGQLGRIGSNMASRNNNSTNNNRNKVGSGYESLIPIAI